MPDTEETAHPASRTTGAPFSLLAFKNHGRPPFVGTITFCRIYSPPARSWPARRCSTPTSGKKERIGRMLLMHANNREDIKGSVGGRHRGDRGPQRRRRTGDTLCDPQKPALLEKMEFPRAGHRDRDRAEVQGPTRRSWASPWRSSRPRIRPSACRPTPSPARPSSRAWASCTSTSRSTSCAAPTRSTRTVGAPQVAYRETITAQVRDRLHAQEADRRHGASSAASS